MNITDFVKEKKTLKDKVLRDFEQYYDAAYKTQSQFHMEKEMLLKVKAHLVEHRYAEFDLSFLEQSQIYGEKDLSIQLPKYTLYSLGKDFSKSNVLLFNYKPFFQKIRIGYLNTGNSVTESYPHEISSHMIKAFDNKKVSEIDKKGNFEVSVSKNTKNYWKKYRRNGELDIYSELLMSIDKDSRDEMLKSVKYFDNDSLYAVYKAEWYPMNEPRKKIVATEPIPIIALLNDKSYLVVLANPDTRISENILNVDNADIYKDSKNGGSEV